MLEAVHLLWQKGPDSLDECGENWFWTLRLPGLECGLQKGFYLGKKQVSLNVMPLQPRNPRKSLEPESAPVGHSLTFKHHLVGKVQIVLQPAAARLATQHGPTGRGANGNKSMEFNGKKKELVCMENCNLHTEVRK